MLHDLELDSTETHVVFAFIMRVRLDGIHGPYFDIKSENSFEILFEIVLSSQEDVMLLPSEESCCICMLFQEHQVTYPGLKPVAQVHLALLQEVIDVNDVPLLIVLRINILLWNRSFHIK